jgi:hypothetical protein
LSSSIWLKQALSEIPPPALRECWHLDGAAEKILVVHIAGIKRRDVSHSHAVIITSCEFDRIAAGHFALSKNGKVETGATASQEALHHVISAESDAKFETRHSWLRHKELRGTYSDPITDSDIRLKQPFGREVLTKRSPRGILPRKLSTPVLVVLSGIGVDSLLRTTVHGEVGLFIAFKVERSNAYGAFHWALPY